MASVLIIYLTWEKKKNRTEVNRYVNSVAMANVLEVGQDLKVEE